MSNYWPIKGFFAGWEMEDGQLAISIKFVIPPSEAILEDLIKRSQACEYVILMPEKEYKKLVPPLDIPQIPTGKIGISGVVVKSHVNEAGVTVIDEFDFHSVSLNTKEIKE